MTRSNRGARFLQARQALQPLLLGAAHAFAFSNGPLPAMVLPWVQVIALTFLALFIWRCSSTRQAALAGWLFGLGQFILGHYWIYISLHTYGGLAAPLAGAAVVLMAAIESLFIMAATGFAYRITLGLRSHCTLWAPVLAAALWASCWTLAEWLRGTLFTGFPWLNIGYAHADGPLSGWIPVLGVYGAAFMAAFVAGAIALLMHAQKTDREQAAAVAVASAIGIAVVGMGLSGIAWFKPEGEPLWVRLVQGNIAQDMKFDPAHMQAGIETYQMLANLPAKEADAQPSLIILPETVIPQFQNRYGPQAWQKWIDIAREQKASIILGIPLVNRLGDRFRYTNSAIGLSADSRIDNLMAGLPAHRYDKHHLVPFGEFVPAGFRWFVDALNIPLGDFDRGALRQPLFNMAGQRIAPDICFEDVFGEEIIHSVRDSKSFGPGATLLVNLSNLAWFGDTWALNQHLQISRVRAMETARPMLRATNTGMTAAIGPEGTVRAVLQPNAPGVLDVQVQGTHGLTPYVRWSNWPVLMLCLAILLAGLVLVRRKPAA